MELTKEKFQDIIGKKNHNDLHKFLLQYASENFNYRDYTGQLVTFLGDHYAYDSDIAEILRMTSGSYMSNIFIELMEKYLPDVFIVFNNVDDDWGVIYFELFAPDFEIKPEHKSYNEELEKFNSEVVGKNFIFIWDLIEKQKDYTFPSANGGKNPLEDFKNVTIRAIFK